MNRRCTIKMREKKILRNDQTLERDNIQESKNMQL